MCLRTCFALVVCVFFAVASPSSGAEPAPQRYDFAQRASHIDPRAQEHPEINFVFQDAKGKVADLQHAAVDTRVPLQGKLVVWLMDQNAGLFERATGFGLHCVQVHYAKGWFGGLSQEVLTDGTSLGKIRLEAATGEDFSPLVNIPQPDGMMERTLQFVKWLAKENPPGRWEQFLTDDGHGVRWDKVIVCGISHGSTTAARFALHRRVDRVVMFSGPRDNTETWQGFPSATPKNRFFGFSHVLDGGWTADHYCRSWLMLGLNQFGPIVDVEQTPPPFGNSRRLITAADVKNDPRRAHTMVVPGGTAVKDAEGRYLHEAVWRYLFTHPVDAVGEPVAAETDCRLEPKR
jgi:hypothetical protein